MNTDMKQMIDRYNELEQAPGVMADGEMTLNETIADLGGMALAYDLWNKKLQADGLSGQQLRHQQRQFFVSYADTWKSYSTDEQLIRQKTKDKHSANHNRVNGLGKTGEGDGKTPIGTLRPLSAFGVKPNPGTTMPYIDVKPTTYACDEDCEYYNKIIDTAETKHECKGEEMYSYQPQYNYGIATDFNKECIFKGQTE